MSHLVFNESKKCSLSCVCVTDLSEIVYNLQKLSDFTLGKYELEFVIIIGLEMLLVKWHSG